MFAVLKTGGKQYKVAAGDTLRVEKLAAEAGDAVQFNDVLMVGDEVGSPFVAGAAVQATVIDQIKGEKTIHFVRRRRKHSSKRTKGHRQQLTLIRVTDILASGGDATGVKAAVGAAFREPAPGGIVVATRRAASQAAAAVAERVEAASEVVGDGAQAAIERAEAAVPAGLVDAARRAASTLRDEAQSVAERVEDAAEKAVEAVTDAASDVTETKTGRVALAAAAAAGVAAIAAAVLLPGTPAEAGEGDATPDAENKE